MFCICSRHLNKDSIYMGTVPSTFQIGFAAANAQLSPRFLLWDHDVENHRNLTVVDMFKRGRVSELGKKYRHSSTYTDKVWMDLSCVHWHRWSTAIFYMVDASRNTHQNTSLMDFFLKVWERHVPSWIAILTPVGDVTLRESDMVT